MEEVESQFIIDVHLEKKKLYHNLFDDIIIPFPLLNGHAP